ncbi:ectonucleotide pyrophosphatase/phosphodiesterase [Capnocytophaga sp.]|uniref:alkaline phosphatase family protein n=1 Tax=Capnocytophaga sp. TaxID=44737 RepID=UPI0026DDACD1|nr:ectonucleotide pyrophosphatase/phosphodiesterase [Capnocytophaga sp.]MDO5104383.1 ectonucleotide pyrophosphatase/phosphodiesterase [Capnocytophaga sp.]
MNQFIKNQKRALFLLVLLLVGCTTQKTAVGDATENYVLLVSFDGFRHDYAEKYNLLNFKKLVKEGASAEMMLSSFPSKTFPNHYSIITGMYAGNHGLVDNKFYVKEKDAFYTIGDRSKVEDASYYKGYPLWQWLQKHGMKTASYFWVGSEAPIQGEFPTYYYKYDEKVPDEERINQVMRWFGMPKSQRPRFITLYFSLVDTEGHHSGPNSEKLKETVQEADRLLGIIIEKVKKTNLPITTIVVSDHGMTEMESNDENLVYIEEVADYLKDKAKFVNNGMHGHIYVKNPEKINEIYDYVQSKLAPRVSLYYRNETPAHWHYNKDERIGDIFLICEHPYYMIPNKNHPTAKKTNKWGTHGYDPYTTPDMGGIFYAFGHNIKEGYKLKSFENINVYPLITNILGVNPPAEIDGKEHVLQPVLK